MRRIIDRPVIVRILRIVRMDFRIHVEDRTGITSRSGMLDQSFADVPVVTEESKWFVNLRYAVDRSAQSVEGISSSELRQVVIA